MTENRTTTAQFPSKPAPLLAATAHGAGAFPNASWVWPVPGRQAEPDWAWFRLHFECGGKAGPLTLRLSADSRYRLFVNGTWAGDGPVRGWPEHWYYDERDLAGLAQAGANELRVLVQYYGCGTFHTIVQEPGFIAELMRGGEAIAATGDGQWQAAPAPEYRDAPEISVQMPPGEIYDARLAEEPAWSTPATIINPRWAGFRARDVREPKLKRWSAGPLKEARRVTLPQVRSVPLLRILHPDTVLEATRKSRALALACKVEVCEAASIPWTRGDFDIYIDGQKLSSDVWQARPGLHRVLAVHPQLHDNRNAKSLGVPDHPALAWSEPLEEAIGEEPWRVLVHPAYHYCADDLHWITHLSADLDEKAAGWPEEAANWGEATANEAAFARIAQRYRFTDNPRPRLQPDPDGAFKLSSEGEVIELAEDPDGDWTIDCTQGAIELAFDLGDQLAGLHELDITAPAGTCVDVSILEYVRGDGIRQHTSDNWNGFRYITREGRQNFTTRQRRSGRHLFVTVSGADGAVTLHSIQILETVFPVEEAAFTCSDPVLTRAWEAAVRTMELSCDDVYIDSLYEQTLWVGDARDEQLYALTAWDARDISLRSIRLAAQSLERLPLVGSQVPSSWFTIIPVWSFLWGISVWEYYAHSGEEDALREFWPQVLKNIRGAAALINSDGLFEAPWWNLFEWADSDFNHRTVLYNSMFLAGAVRAAIRCGEVLGASNELPWLRTLEARLKRAVRTTFDHGRGLFPEAIRADGTPTDKFSIHPQFLAVLFDMVETPEEAEALLDKVADNEGELVGLASPFAFQFYAEAFEKAGREDHLIERMRAFYEPMIEAGTTLWEALPGSMTSPEGFPTRSHCHGWSSAPMDLLPRIVLGLRQTEPGEPAFTCSPQPHGLTHASGTRATPWGTIRVSWRIDGTTCRVSLAHPPALTVGLKSNRWLEQNNLTLESDRAGTG